MAPASLLETQPSARHEEAAAFERYVVERDPRDREALLQRYLPLAMHLTRRYHAAGEREDLEQVASLGLLKAIDRFDPSRGLAFTSFAVPTIVGELKRYFRDHGWSVRVPRSLQELGARVSSTADELQRELGRAPTIDEIAERCETTSELVLEARHLASAHRADSLDAPVSDPERSSRLETFAVEENGYGRVEGSVDLDRLLAQLAPRERKVLQLRFFEELTQREIAERVGLSQMHVSRLIRSTLAELYRLAQEPDTRPGRPLLMPRS
jgi:RNA polymerase sigma-B factor